MKAKKSIVIRYHQAFKQQVVGEVERGRRNTAESGLYRVNILIRAPTGK